MSELDFGYTNEVPKDSGHRMKIFAISGGLDCEVICQARERGERCGLNPPGPRTDPELCPVDHLLSMVGLDGFSVIGVGVEKVELTEVKVGYDHEGWGEDFEDWITFDPTNVKDE